MLTALELIRDGDSQCRPRAAPPDGTRSRVADRLKPTLLVSNRDEMDVYAIRRRARRLMGMTGK
jgi:hypothetical protein